VRPNRGSRGGNRSTEGRDTLSDPRRGPEKFHHGSQTAKPVSCDGFQPHGSHTATAPRHYSSLPACLVNGGFAKKRLVWSDTKDRPIGADLGNTRKTCHFKTFFRYNVRAVGRQGYEALEIIRLVQSDQR
jgi:hypothetical protein